MKESKVGAMNERGDYANIGDHLSGQGTGGTTLETEAVGQKDLARLRQLLTEHFDLEELRTLCFDLKDVDYDDLGGEGKANKARELVAYLERRDRIPELVELCSQRRPNVDWKAKPQTTPDTLSEPEHSRSIREGLLALADLMQTSQVRTAVVQFGADFEAAREQALLLGHYKCLHDLLHTLQFHCYAPIVQEAKRFPDDDMAVDNLMDYEVTLQQIVGDLQGAAEQASFASTETLWIQDLVKARETLARGLDELDVKLLQRTIWLLNRVLAVQPSQINTRLNAAARALRLPTLVKAMAYISDNLARLDLDSEKVNQFEAGVDALIDLNHRLSICVDSHDKWQMVDLELRRIEANIKQDLMELEMSWPDLKTMTEPLHSGCGEEWAISFNEYSNDLDSAIAAENPAKIRRSFRRYRRQAGACFYRVDVNLKMLCDDLRTVGEPLALVIKMIGE